MPAHGAPSKFIALTLRNFARKWAAARKKMAADSGLKSAEMVRMAVFHDKSLIYA